MEYLFSHRLKSEVDEWAEARSVKGSEAENESGYRKHEGDNMLTFVVVGEVDLILPS